MSEEIAKCRCGATPEVEPPDALHDFFNVACWECEIEGDARVTRREAIKAWNKVMEVKDEPVDE